ncbi:MULTISPECIES: flagellar protein FlgN [Bacillales]|uniref:Flagellar protein FlgN n=1 Tax=Lysinibacillus louembei TaxID=1470088 RepID=A0ABZ0RW07_9BACI|nr:MULTISPECIES: flagellar protein FlgN [Bacillales]MCT6925684.1 flagellar protein FlgN [Metasolibacillus sp.]MCT6941004.1 flagellar protein FlgN [Metasolibacillus sp.]WPK12417.1 flagellar protein FlgN [Lysinibacillus louembei]
MSVLTILEKLERMHKSLLELALKKTDIIKINDIAALDELIKTEQAHVAAINTLEQQRQLMVTDYLRAKGIAYTDTPTVAELIDAIDSDEEKQQLIATRDRLLTLLTELKARNDLNQKLVYQSLQIINIQLEPFRPQRSDSFNYSGDEVRGQANQRKVTYYDSQA